MELTREYFDKQLGKRLDEQSKDLKSFVTDLVEKEVGGLARMTSNRFDEMEAKLDSKAEGKNLNSRVVRIEQALNIK